MRILIADDHALFRDGLRSLLEARDLDVVGEARDGAEAVALARLHRPDIVLMDLNMPDTNGLVATTLICAEMPEIRVVVLTASDDDADLFQAVKSGAQGYLPKNVAAEDLFAFLDGVMNGEPALTPVLARKVLGEFSRYLNEKEKPAETMLTDREHDVLALLVEGVTSNRELATRLFVSENTIKYHLRNILAKLHLNNRAQVIAYAVRHGLVDAERES
ncbi:MAG: response regulator [Thermomicrobiales bacterium]